ncbi:MAG: carboxypeptidase-like regulatory domain-containing protein [Muribaculaceae bacterium]|nr:carboxypeptidase-like regulatory domain-containing protein [Muribaculaceae bacterium]
MSKKLIFLFIWFTCLIPLQAQEVITGTVVDSKNQPIPGVRVEVVGRSEVTTTDIDGTFRLDLPVAVKKLRFQYVGHKPIERNVKPDMIVKMGHGWQGRDTGYRGFFDFMGGFGTGGVMNFHFQDESFTDIGKSSIMFGLSMTHGYQINPMFFAGVGVGVTPLMLYCTEDSGDYLWGEHAFYGIACQFYADFRWDYDIKAKTSPFVDLKLGYQRIFAIHDFIDAYSNWYGYGNEFELESTITKGVLLMPTIGLRTAIGAKSAFNVGLSYNIMVKRAFNVTGHTNLLLPNGEAINEHTDPKTFSSIGGCFMLNFGFDF